MNEFGEKIILLPPKYSLEKVKGKLAGYEGCEVIIVEPEYPKKELVVEQDRANFDEIFDIRRIDINDALGISEIEGCIFFPVLKNEDTYVRGIVAKFDQAEILVNGKMRIRWKNRYGRPSSEKKAFEHDSVSMCNKGILIESNKSSIWNYRFDDKLFPMPFVCVNFPKTISDISISRFESNSESEIMKTIWDNLHNLISSELLERRKKLFGYELWRIITLYRLEYRLNVEKMSPCLFEGISYPFINEEGAVAHNNIDDLDTVKLIPSIMKSAMEQYVKTGKYEKEKNWNYGNCLLAIRENHYTGYDFEGAINSTIYESLQHNFYFKEYNFVKEKNSEYLLKQEVWERGTEKDYVVKQIVEILNDFNVFYERDGEIIKEIYSKVFYFTDLANFAESYKDYFAYCFGTINLNHPKTKLLIKYIWCLNDMLYNKVMSKVEVGMKKDLLEELPFLRTGYDFGHKKYSFDNINKTFEELHNWLKAFYPSLGKECIKIGKEDFVEKSISIKGDDCFWENRQYSL